MAEEAALYAEKMGEHLMKEAIAIFNRKGSIAMQLGDGNSTNWTAAEAATIMKQVVDEVLFTEAANQGQSLISIQETCPDLLARALHIVGTTTWRDASGVRTIDDAVDFEVLGEQANLLVKTLEERCLEAEGDHKEAYKGLLVKGRSLLLDHKGQAMQTTSQATLLGKTIALQDTLRGKLSRYNANLQQSLDSEPEGTAHSRATLDIKQKVDKCDRKLAAAYAQGTKAARELDARIALKVTGDVAFGGLTFNGLVAQLKVLDAASPAAPRRVPELKEPERQKSTGGNKSAHKDAVKGGAARTYKNVFGVTDTDWNEETADFNKCINLFAGVKQTHPRRRLLDPTRGRQQMRPMPRVEQAPAATV
jgi:hypothetical protein